MFLLLTRLDSDLKVSWYVVLYLCLIAVLFSQTNMVARFKSLGFDLKQHKNLAGLDKFDLKPL